MKKAELRLLYKKKRLGLSDSQVELWSLGILSQLQKMDFSNKSVFHSFLSIPNRKEVDTSLINEWLFDLKKTVAVPAVRGEEMDCCEFKQDMRLKAGPFGTLEPENCKILDPKKIEVMFLPMLICDLQGNRVGYGGGYYDRFLTGCRKDMLKIGLSFFEPVKKVTDVLPTDKTLDYCVTPEEIVSFTKE